VAPLAGKKGSRLDSVFSIGRWILWVLLAVLDVSSGPQVIRAKTVPGIILNIVIVLIGGIIVTLGSFILPANISGG
jgi:hypothetical protein